MTALAAFSALSHPTRLAVFRLLVRAGARGVPAGEIATALEVKPNTLSAQLAQLEQAGLVEAARQGRSIRYAARMEALGDLVAFLLEECCGGDQQQCRPVIRNVLQRAQEETQMPQRPYHMLFLCTGNSARSIMAEAILAREGGGRFKAHSAGSNPKPEPHPYALELLQRSNHPVADLRSKSWSEFSGPDAPELDFVVTLCDDAANETCPVWPGQPISAHWGMPDPAAATGAEAEKRLAFADAYRMLANRISTFTSLPIESLDRLKLKKRMDQIGAPK